MPDTLPRFSVVIPTYNRPLALAACLDALTSLDYPRHLLEVIVVDDGSSASLGPVVERHRADLNVVLHRQANAGPAKARNAGARLATGRYLAFTDDDCAPAPSWLSSLARHFIQTPNATVGGRTINVLDDNPFASASQLLIDYLYDYFDGSGAAATFFASNNFAVPTKAFLDAGGFDERFPLAAAEDREFCDRWARLGHPMVHAVDAVVRHAHAMRLRGFLRQHYNYGRGAYHFHQAKARQDGGRIRIEPGRFYWNLVRYPMTREAARPASASALMVASQVANVAGYGWERLATLTRGTRHDDQRRPALQ